jgi:hypothetical protein
MKDLILQAAVMLVAKEPEAEIGVTLIVDGFLVSGYIISYRRFSEYHPLTKMFIEQQDKLLSKPPTDKEAEQDQEMPNFIHLRDAKFFTPGQRPIPAKDSLCCRIALDKVSGFHFGNLHIEEVAP